MPATPSKPPADAPHKASPAAISNQAIEQLIFALLASRAHEATVCPSEVARALASEATTWRALMPQVRQVAHHLAASHRLRVTRGGVEVEALAGGGPIRLGRPKRPPQT